MCSNAQTNNTRGPHARELKISFTTMFDLKKNCKINRIFRKRGTLKLIKTNQLREKDMLLTDIITIATLHAHPFLPQNHPKTQPN